MGSDNKPDQFGEVYMATEDYGGDGGKLSLSKAKLGLFMYSLLKCDGKICSMYGMNRKYDRSYVQAMIKIKPEKIAELEEMSGVKLMNPPTLSLN